MGADLPCNSSPAISQFPVITQWGHNAAYKKPVALISLNVVLAGLQARRRWSDTHGSNLLAVLPFMIEMARTDIPPHL